MNRIQRHLSPSLVISCLALFLAAGGTGYALGKRATPQLRCQPGAIRGVAEVVGDSGGIANLPGDYTNSPSFFDYRWNCSGGTILVRKAPSVTGGFDIRFVGNAASTAVVTAVGGTTGAVSVQHQQDGSFRVLTAAPAGPGPAGVQATPLQFVIVLT